MRTIKDLRGNYTRTKYRLLPARRKIETTEFSEEVRTMRCLEYLIRICGKMNMEREIKTVCGQPIVPDHYYEVVKYIRPDRVFYTIVKIKESNETKDTAL